MNNFLLHEKIKTTEAKAKELRSIAEKMITRAKMLIWQTAGLLGAEFNSKNDKKNN